MTDQRPRFPCDALLDDAAAARLLGLYRQRDGEHWMQRVKLLGGDADAAHWRVLAAVAGRYTPTAPLHLTTRQEIELHELAGEDVPAVQHALADAGLTGLGACGDTLRNVTVCACSGVRAGRADLHPLARQARRLLEATPGIYDLPRKLKISFSACENACAGPCANGLGFVARADGNGWTFDVFAGGSLGARPALGIRAFERVAPSRVLPLIAGAARVFAEHGDRENRRRARLRHVRERVGDEAFVAMLADAADQAERDRKWPDVPLQADGPFESWRTLTFHNGDVTPRAAEAIADLLDAGNCAVRVARHHRVVLFGLDADTLGVAVAEHPALHGPATPQPSVVACPGTRWCSRGLADTNDLADRLRDRLSGVLPSDATVCVSGCPNGCAHSRIADIGLVGGRANVDDRRQDVYTVYAGGGMGRDNRLAERVALRLPADATVDTVIRIAGGPQRAGGTGS